MTRESEYWRCDECGWSKNVREDGPICENCGADGRDEQEPDEAYLERMAEQVGVPLWQRV